MSMCQCAAGAIVSCVAAWLSGVIVGGGGDSCLCSRAGCYSLVLQHGYVQLVSWLHEL